MVEIPRPVNPPRSAVPQPSSSAEDLSDLTSVSKEDILGMRMGNDPDDVVEDVNEIVSFDEEDMDEVLGVDREDILGDAPETPSQLPVVKLPKRPVVRRPIVPPTSIGGVGY